ncbi:unnamed protein product [Paramecium sonneborni]|uniref:TLDc domain-containing protein n=1 Tax=Paramecium sonneborni TaxID=65129 RepID=A0A8S1RPV1_9CILI|nr:unnamed protein product [Paramecium sonneborni]
MQDKALELTYFLEECKRKMFQLIQSKLIKINTKYNKQIKQIKDSFQCPKNVKIDEVRVQDLIKIAKDISNPQNQQLFLDKLQTGLNIWNEENDQLLREKLQKAHPLIKTEIKNLRLQIQDLAKQIQQLQTEQYNPKRKKENQLKQIEEKIKSSIINLNNNNNQITSQLIINQNNQRTKDSQLQQLEDQLKSKDDQLQQLDDQLKQMDNKFQFLIQNQNYQKLIFGFDYSLFYKKGRKQQQMNLNQFIKEVQMDWIIIHFGINIMERSGYIFGGYSPCQWQKDKGWVQDDILSYFCFHKRMIKSILSNKIQNNMLLNVYLVMDLCMEVVGTQFKEGSSNLGLSYQWDKYENKQSNHLFGQAKPNVTECEIFELKFI